MYYVHGLGIDYKDGQYEIFMQLINFSNVAKSESPNPQATQSEIGHSKGKTLEEAITKDIDIYRLSEHLYRKNAKVWKKLEKDGKIPLTPSSISKLEIDVKVNSGRKTFVKTMKE
ncbi:hypothetical protein ACQKMV_17855 [Lysinibacillus sp. NPDC094403]|uniref:Ger(x)C family spore germination protein n=1 Tax=Lysinibacillus sp. NPDC094403 TaxID=3390581 RepID=UPI003D02E864